MPAQMRGALLCFTVFSGCLSLKQDSFITVEKYGTFDVNLMGPSTSADFNPYVSVQLKADFVHQQKNVSISVSGFYDGNAKYILR